MVGLRLPAGHLGLAAAAGGPAQPAGAQRACASQHQPLLAWKRLRPLRSLKNSLPSLPIMAASSGTVTGRLARQVREACDGSENGSCGR